MDEQGKETSRGGAAPLETHRHRGRQPPSGPPNIEVAGVIAAAGESKRMGRDKLLLPYRGRAMIFHVVKASLASSLSRVAVVLGRRAGAVGAEIARNAGSCGGRGADPDHPTADFYHFPERSAVDPAEKDFPAKGESRLILVYNSAYQEGMSASLRAGMSAVETGNPDGVMILLGDMPRVTAVVINRLLAAFGEGGADIVAPVYRGRRGHPVLLSRRFFPAIKALTGDTGARSILAAHGRCIRFVALDDPAVVTDIDTPDDVSRLRRSDGSGFPEPLLSSDNRNESD